VGDNENSSIIGGSSDAKGNKGGENESSIETTTTEDKLYEGTAAWDDMKKDHKGEITKFMKARKPKGSPKPKKWFGKGGSLKIRDLPPPPNGAQIWEYKMGDITVPYVPQKMPDGTVENVIKFPDEYLYPNEDISSFTVKGGFTGDRTLDRQKALEYLEDNDVYAIPDGYVLHHDIDSGDFQLVREDVHSMFSHYGGFYYNK